MWKIEVRKQADKFNKKENIEDKEIVSLMQKFINYAKGMDESINANKMKGKWKGYYRIKAGKIRIILKVNFTERKIYMDRIDFRGDVYK